MGNEESNANLSRANNKKEEASIGFCDNVSSYQGLKSEASEKTSHKSSDQISDKTTERTTEAPELKVSIPFEWREGGNNVVLTGSFVNWQKFYQMTRSSNGAFELVLSLDPGIHQFKFVVDNQWKCSNAYEKIDDGNHNTNNIIDTMKVLQKTQPTQTSSSTKEPDSKPTASPLGQSQKKGSYSVITPKKSEMNTEAPSCPFHYLHTFNIDHNTRQTLIGKQKYLQFNESNLLSENNSYKKIFVPPHVNVNHQCLSTIKQTCIRASISQRNKHKYITFIYYLNKRKMK